MRKLFLLSCLLVFVLQSFGQHYVLEYEIDHRHTAGRDVQFCHTLEYKTNKGYVGKLNVINEDAGKRSGSINIACSQGFVTRIHTIDGRIKMKIITWLKPDRGNETFGFDYMNSDTDFDVYLTENYWAEFYWTMLLVPFWVSSRYAVDCRFKFYPIIRKTSNTDILHRYEKVDVSFSEGFPMEVYRNKWEYRIGDEKDWHKVDESLIKYSHPHRISVCSNDLLNEKEFAINMGKDIHFRILVSAKQTASEVITMRINPYLKKTSTSQTLPYNKKVDIAFTSGYGQNIYNWQYKIADGSWKNIPYNLFDFNNPHRISVCGADLMDEATAIDNVGKTIQFRVHSPNDVDCEIIPLTISPPSLPIKEVIAENPKCNGDDGKLDVVFYRSLRDYEGVICLFNGMHTSSQRAYLSEDRQHFIIVMDSLSMENYTVISLRSKIKINKSDYFSDEYVVNIYDYLSLPAPVKFTALRSDVLCHGDSSGTITVKPTGGTGVYSIMLDSVEVANGVTGEYIIDSLSEGTYFVKVYDSNDCSHHDTIIKISQPSDQLSIDNISLTEPKGFHTHDGQIEVQVSGGTPPYTVYCKDSLDFSYPLVQQVDSNFKNITLHRGRYTIFVEDSLKCKVVQNTILESPEELRVQIEQVAGIKCYGFDNGQLTANAVGGVDGYRYSWFKIKDKDTVTAPLYMTAGLYRVVVTDDNGIKASAEYELTQPDSITIDFPVHTPPTCGNQHRGRIEAAVRGGTSPYTYRWTNGDTIAHASIAKGGLHSLFVTDANGCEAENSITVEVPGELSVSHTATAPTCHGLSDGRIELEVSGGMAPYTVRWADELWETPATIPALAQRGPNALADEDSGGPDFGGQLTRTDLPAGRYEAVVTDSAGCEVAVSVVLEQPEPIALWLGHDITLCSGARTLLSAQTNRHGLRYSWRTPWGFAPQTEPQLWVDAAGSYAVTATDSAGCTVSDTVRVLQGVEELPLDITAPSSAAARATVHAVNLSPDGVEQVRWILPAEAEVVRTNDAEAVFIMPRSGTYQLAFEGRTDRCTATIGQPLEILDTLVLPSSDDVPLIQQFLLSPSGLQLAVRVELREASRMVLNLLSPDGRLIDQHVQPSAKTHTHRFALKGLPAGEYQVVLQVGGQVATMRYTKQE